MWSADSCNKFLRFIFQLQNLRNFVVIDHNEVSKHRVISADLKIFQLNDVFMSQSFQQLNFRQQVFS